MRVFNPAEIFRTLYRRSCFLGTSAFAEARHLSSELICADIEAHVISMFAHLRYGEKSAAALRRQSLETNSRFWKLLRSSVDCFVCLQRKPEHLTSCGHGICDTCVSLAVFSRRTKGRESYYDIRTCPQCQAEILFQARLLPKTCRVRFLAFDGGGSRGIVSLAFMEELRQALGLRYPVQENFDYAIGTSSG